MTAGPTLPEVAEQFGFELDSFYGAARRLDVFALKVVGMTPAVIHPEAAFLILVDAVFDGSAS